MNALQSNPRSTVTNTESPTFRFNEGLCTEILMQLQTHLTPGVRQARFGCINGRRAAVYVAGVSYGVRTLWLFEDDVRDWFVARYSHDLQHMQEIEQEILAEFGAQLMEQRLHDSQNHHGAVTQSF
jgi:hypothetical protein